MLTRLADTIRNRAGPSLCRQRLDPGPVAATAPTVWVAAFLVGWAILRLVALVPTLGGLVWFAAVVFGLGVLEWLSGGAAPPLGLPHRRLSQRQEMATPAADGSSTESLAGPQQAPSAGFPIGPRELEHKDRGTRSRRARRELTPSQAGSYAATR